MRYGILGPLRLLDEEGRTREPRGRQRELLAFLLVHAGRPVPADRLIDVLWGDRLPANPGNALQQRVFAVRKMLGDDAPRLVTVVGGYRLDVDDDDIDARRFERLADAGRAALAAGEAHLASERLDEALALWLGDPLGGIDAVWARTEAERLLERRLGAREDRIEARLALGRHRSVIGELDELAIDHPLRERLHAQLMVALARAGRQADALAAYQHLRDRLVDELGIDPSPQLQQIHHDVLTQQVALLPAPTPRTQTGTKDRTGPAWRAVPATADLVGRDEQLAQLTELLGEHRLVTVCGPGGVGKTRIATEIVRRVEPDGVNVVELGSVVDPDAVVAAVTAVLEVPSPSSGSAVESLVSALAQHPTLLVLDSCEHLTDAVADLVGALARCPGLRVLATSREPLGLKGERVWHLPPLAAPEGTVTSTEDALASSAVRLFCDRVADVLPGYALTDDDVADVVHVVRRLDGLPLAIELAAARLRILSLGDLAARLDDRFPLLATNHRGTDDRHRTLWNTVGWSWELLDDAGRAAWMAASVPVAPFAADLLEPLLDAAGADLDPLDAIQILCDHSLLTVHERSTPTRYRMLETIRRYGHEQIAAAGIDTRLRVAHATTVEEAVRAADRTDELIWDVDLETQGAWLPEVRAALRWRLANDDQRGAQRLAAALGWLWYLHALAPEGLRALTEALGPLDELDPGAVEPAAVLWAAILRVNAAPHDDGMRWARLAADLATEPVDQRLADVFVANHLAVAGHVDEALAMTQAAHGDNGWLGGTRRLLSAQLLTSSGHVAEAEAELVRAEQQLLAGGAWWGVWASSSLVQLAQLRGDVDALQRAAGRAIDVCTRRGLADLEVELCAVLALVAASTGDDADADERLRRADELVARTGVSTTAALVAAARGYVLSRRGDRSAARRHFRAALALHERTGQALGRPFALWGLGHLALTDDDHAAARRFHHRAVGAALDRGDGDAIARALEGLAATCIDVAHALQGAQLLGAAAARRGHMGAPRPVIGRDEAVATESAIRRLLGDEAFEHAAVTGADLDEHRLQRLVDAVTDTSQTPRVESHGQREDGR